MELNPYIKESDLLTEKHYPIYVFFNMISDDDFLEICENFSKGRGRGIDFAVCLFPDDIDIDSDKFDGVEFSLHSGEEVVVDYPTFYFYLNKAYERYIETCPADKGKIEKLLTKIRQRFDF